MGAAFQSTAFVVIALISIFILALGLIVALFDPGLRYKLSTPELPPVDSDEFLKTLEALTGSRVHRQSTFEVLTNGEEFYEAELQAIGRAQQTINFEAYIFQRGEVARRFLQALTERARAGVCVNMVLDAIGSAGTWKAELKKLRDAGGHFAWYHPLWWNTWPQFNNRTHRELIVIDGRVAFVGGAGFADHWMKSTKRNPRWRDTMVRVEGDAVTGLQATFAENWLEATGEILAGEQFFPFPAASNNTRALVIPSTPSAGGSTSNRILFQTLLSAAEKSIHIMTPYFLPDHGALETLRKAATERGVDVRILVPGRHADHFLSRRSSRRMYGALLEAGARIFEYTPSMMHAKVLLIDGLWSVVGSTNFDYRSFRLNDEVNLAAADSRLCARLQEDFVLDLAESREITLRDWKRRSLFDRVNEYLGWVLERQE